MLDFDLNKEAHYDTSHHVEKILGTVEGGDVTAACWAPGQISPDHAHPDCTEIYVCMYGGGTMRTPDRTVAVTPGSFVVHPPGEMHEYINGPQNSLLFRVRYSGKPQLTHHAHHLANRGKKDWTQKPADAEYFKAHPVPAAYAAETAALGARG
ncbi:MAG: cupin domain-containing protein [Pseudomonadota bacterium]